MNNTISNFLKYLNNELWQSITLFGTPLFYITVIFLISIQSDKLNIAHTPIAFFLLEIACFFMKMVIPKNRPSSKHPVQFSNTYQSRSFPSIHFARATFLAAVVFNTFPTNFINVYFICIAVLVGISRIYLKQHDFIDVLGGFAIGILFGITWQLLYIK